MKNLKINITKHVIYISFFAFLIISFSSCTKKYYCCDNCNNTNVNVDASGLTNDIHSILPDSLLTIIKGLGMPINGGSTPPVLDGTYLVSSYVLTNSNISTDIIGTSFADFRITFKNQNNSNLSVDIDYINGPEIGSGIKSYIVGSGSKFTVFAEINGNMNGEPFKNVYAFSGDIESSGILNFKSSLIMTNDYGDPLNQYISIGDTRVFKDEDGFSPKQ